MSLLLEALKKAELAKQSADASPVDQRANADAVITRDTLPDISQALDIRPNDLPSAASAAAETPFGPAPVEVTPSPLQNRNEAAAPPPFETSYGGMSAAVEDTPEAVQRAAARQMFEAKEADLPHPKRNFYITLGALGLLAAGYAGYVWWQLQPRSIYNAAAATKKGGDTLPPSAAPASVPAPPAPTDATAPAAPTAAVAAASPTTPDATAPASNPAQAGTATKAAGAPATAAVVPDRAAPRPRSPVAAPEASSASVAPRRPSGTRAAEQRNPATPFSVTPSTLAADPQIERGYEAFQQGDLTAARNQYQSALQREPANRDALLGLAAIDMRTRNYELAESRYLRLLEADPRDAHALAGLIALRGQTDPLQSESRLKSLISMQPEVGHLHFALGNQYAAQSRWPEAQAAYFKAFSLDPENPDFAFNLAVSLDHLRQGKVALDYYRRALALSGNRATSFDKNQVSARISELSR
jgi:tetratricopeptide (TPR) repeat protein